MYDDLVTRLNFKMKKEGIVLDNLATFQLLKNVTKMKIRPHRLADLLVAFSKK